MKITFVLPGLFIAGGVKTVLECSNELVEFGHDVTIIYPWQVDQRDDEWFGFKSILRKLKYSFNGYPNSRCHWFNIKAKLIRVPDLSSKFIPEADVIVATWWKTAEWINSYSSCKGRKFYLVQHYEIWGGAKHQVEATYKMPLKKIVISSWLKQIMKQKFNEQVFGPIMNGVRLKQFYNENKQFHNPRKIGMLFHTADWKGMDDGLEAVSIVKKKYPNIQLIMFGIMSNTVNKINFPCEAELYINPTQEFIRKIYSSCDIWVCPSHAEGGPPMPSQEAVACKCALVTTDVGAVQDIFEHDVTALISPAKDPYALAKNIEILLNDEGKLKRLSNTGYEHIKQFTWQNFAKQIENIFITNV